MLEGGSDRHHPFELDGSIVHVVTIQLLNFETTDVHLFTVALSGGINLGYANVTIDVQDVKEPAVIVLNPPAPSINTGSGSESQLIIGISDPEFGDIDS